MNKVELLAPAGSPEALNAAIGEGADAVYLGLKEFNARMRSANFSYPQFEGLLRALHRMGRKVYVTVNTVFQQREADRVYRLLKYLAALGPDGIMVQDFGVVTMAREHFPSLKLFASTQMNVASARGANLLSRQGFSRVVLSRELSLEELREIRANTNLELEVFIHGSLCVSISGLCLFSSYLGGKSANRGMCTQACRRYFTLPDKEEGGYFFSPADLELIEQIPDLVETGIDSFKIEGRMKSAEYVGTVVSAYRMVIDSLDSGEGRIRGAIADAKKILRNDFARPKTKFLLNDFGNEYSQYSIDWLNPKQDGGTGIPLGTLKKVRDKSIRNPTSTGLIEKGVIAPSIGDSIRLHRADDTERLSHKVSVVEKDPKGFWISIPEGFRQGDSVYLIQTKAMTRRYPKVITGEMRGRSPGRDRAPFPRESVRENSLENTRAKKQQAFPGGYYAFVSGIEDLYILQSEKPVKVILPFSMKLVNKLLGSHRQPLPFAFKDIIFSIDPYFPQWKEEELNEGITALLEEGYSTFIVNNLGHFSFFRNEKDITLIAGPWLYSFNVWAWDFLKRCGADYCISPLENNRQNLEKTFNREKNSSFRRSDVFLTIFARPSLFRLSRDLRAFYGLEYFTDNRKETFQLIPHQTESLVLPFEAFSIIDKTPFLKEAGFNRFILDFSSMRLKKSEYRDIMEALSRTLPLPGTSRFNWKNGFYTESDKENS
ncbi:MAG: U32 family peptidase [Treponema sp.]|nr:U32 family peptidase [Treponema sp.]